MDRAIPDQSLALAVFEAVAARDGRALSELPPLREGVDPEALDGLFASRFDDTPRDGGRVTFPYAGYTVVVTADGRVDLRDSPGASPASDGHGPTQESPE